MDVSKYQSLIDKQRRRAIEDIQNSFIEFVSIDILECGQVEYLIAEDDWYLYWQDISSEIKYIIDDLIELQEDLPKDKFDELLKECIKIKMIADKGITENKHYDPNKIYNDLGFGYSDIQILNS